MLRKSTALRRLLVPDLLILGAWSSGLCWYNDLAAVDGLPLLTMPAMPITLSAVALGLLGPTYKEPTDAPLSRGRWYMDLDGRRETWRRPSTPLLHTKGGTTGCGEGVPVLDVPENATTVEIVINNLPVER